MNTNDFLLELASIIRGENKAWAGDRIENAERFCRRLANDFEDAQAIADDIERNFSDCAYYCGMSPMGLRWAVNRIRESLPR